MRFRRGFRRKPRVSWMPVPGTAYNNGATDRPGGPPNQHTAIEFGFLAGAIGNEPDTVSAPLVVDQPLSTGTGGTTLPVWQQFSLNQTIQYKYRLRRIVGDIFLAVKPGDGNQDVTFGPGVLIQAGIMVRKVTEQGQPSAQAVEQDVGSIQNDTDPWVWRRQWVFGGNSDPQAFNPIVNVITSFPQNNIAYGTKHHIAVDQKTNRVIGPEERLFLNLTVWGLPLDGSSFGPTLKDNFRYRVYLLMPYRVVASGITPNSGNRRNASR